MKLLKKIIKGQKGQALPIVLILLVIGGLLIVPTLKLASGSLIHHRVIETKTMELYSADSGVEDALHWLIHGRVAEGPWDDWDEEAGYGEREAYDLNDRDVEVKVKRIGDNIYKITSKATSPSGNTTVLSTVWAIYSDDDFPVEHNEKYHGDVNLTGDDATLQNRARIIGNVTASGSITLENQSSITGDVSVEGNITLENNTTITGAVCAAGDITLENNALIEGDVRVGHGSTITLEEPAQILGNIWGDGDVSIYIRTNGDIGCEGNSNVGHVHADGNINLIYLGNPQAIIWGTVTAGGEVPPPEGKGEIKGIGTPDPDGPPECPLFLGPARILTWEIT